jgi:uncharacterized protein
MAAAHSEVERSCVVTRRVHDPADMIRFVLSPEREVVPDLKRKLPGRGVWVTARADYVAQAVRKGAFERGFKTKLTVSADLAARIDDLLVRDALQFLALANKAGVVIAGSAKVEAAIAKGSIALLLHASDGGADGVRKLGQALARSLGEGAQGVPRLRLFDTAQMDLALGRSNVIHAALKVSAAADAFAERCRRLEHYRSSTVAEPRGPEAANDVATHHDGEVTTGNGCASEDKMSGSGPRIEDA